MSAKILNGFFTDSSLRRLNFKTFISDFINSQNSAKVKIKLFYLLTRNL